MKNFILALLLLSTPAMADCHRWGPVDDQTTLCVEDSSDAFAEVRIYNSKVTGGPNIVTAYFTIKGVDVTVIDDQQFGDTPDEVQVLVPAGYIAIPESVIVKERGTAIIKIYQEGMS